MAIQTEKIVKGVHVLSSAKCSNRESLKGEQLQCVPPPSEVLKQMFSEGDHEDKVEPASIRTLVLPDKVCA